MRGVGEGEKLIKNYEARSLLRRLFLAGYNFLLLIMTASALDYAGRLPISMIGDESN